MTCLDREDGAPYTRGVRDGGQDCDGGAPYRRDVRDGGHDALMFSHH